MFVILAKKKKKKGKLNLAKETNEKLGFQQKKR